MGGSDKHRKFFRLRSGVPVDQLQASEPNHLFWLVEPMRLVDFDEETLINEIMAISQYFPAFSYTNLREMAFDRYQQIADKTTELQKKEKG